VGALHAQPLDERVWRQSCARPCVALERAPRRPDRCGRRGDAEVAIEIVANPRLKVADETVGLGQVADRGFDAQRRSLIDEQVASDGVRELRLARETRLIARSMCAKAAPAVVTDPLWITIRDMSSSTRL
jgi:hypothetical protein